MNYGDGETQGYSFDPMGNRLTKTDSVTGNESYTYNSANMLLTRGSGSYTKDNNGNTLTGGGRTNTWDGENRLTQCVYKGTTSSFTYGSNGLRRRSVTGANTTDYVLDGQSAVRTLLNGAVDTTWLHGARGPEYERTGSGSPLWYLYDGLGSVLGTVDGSGNIVNTRKYDVYGAVRTGTGGSGPKHKFVGALGHPSEDETGLVYMRARYMDPVTGRFTNEDASGSGANWYVYADSSPTASSDRTGNRSEFSWATLQVLLDPRLPPIGVSLRNRMLTEALEDLIGTRVEAKWVDRLKRYLGMVDKPLKVNGAIGLVNFVATWLGCGSAAVGLGTQINVIASTWATEQWFGIVGCDMAFEDGI